MAKPKSKTKKPKGVKHKFMVELTLIDRENCTREGVKHWLMQQLYSIPDMDNVSDESDV